MFTMRILFINISRSMAGPNKVESLFDKSLQDFHKILCKIQHDERKNRYSGGCRWHQTWWRGERSPLSASWGTSSLHTAMDWGQRG
jgi:hypothetical protein